jgi:S1-C subfamily serine protease
MVTRSIGVLLGLSLFFGAISVGQEAGTGAKQGIPIATQMLLSGVKSPERRSVIKSVLMIQCPKDAAKGTGFVLTGGSIITTNSHVVGNCSVEELIGISSVSDEPVKFSRMETDPARDLALLCASKPLPSSLELSGNENPVVETEVETWGYPLRYQQPAPILSRGYIAGYTVKPGTSVKHLIVNGALNPGNSGGPLVDRATGKVIGIVVEKWTLWSPNIETAIRGFSHPQVGTGGTFSRINAQGQRESVTDQEMLSEVLKEFYNVSQVMVGEAISVSELNAFVKERRQALACGR